MITVGFDLDKVVSLSRFAWIQVILDHVDEKFFWQLQKYKFLQRFYNYFFRIPNTEVREVMKKLKEIGLKVIIISAENENCRQELERWFLKKGFCFDELHLKQIPDEDHLAYKKRMASLCVYYLDNDLEVVNHINGRINDMINDNGRCLAFIYQGQKKEELFKLYLPLPKIFKTV